MVSSCFTFDLLTFHQSPITCFAAARRNVEDDELPEVDQNTKKSLRSRAAAGKAK